MEPYFSLCFLHVYRMIKTRDNEHNTWRSCIYLVRINKYSTWFLWGGSKCPHTHTHIHTLLTSHGPRTNFSKILMNLTLYYYSLNSLLTRKLKASMLQFWFVSHHGPFFPDENVPFIIEFSVTNSWLLFVLWKNCCFYRLKVIYNVQQSESRKQKEILYRSEAQPTK